MRLRNILRLAVVLVVLVVLIASMAAIAVSLRKPHQPEIGSVEGVHDAFLRQLPHLVSHLPLKNGPDDTKGLAWQAEGTEASERRLGLAADSRSTRFHGRTSTIRTSQLKLLGSAGFSLGITVDSDLTGAEQVIFAETSVDEAQACFMLSVTRGGKLSVYIRNDAGQVLLDTEGNRTEWLDDGWSHRVVFTQAESATGDGSEWALYIDGVLDAKGTWQPAGTFTTGSSAIGPNCRTTGRLGWQGWLANFFACSAALSAEEVKADAASWWPATATLPDQGSIYRESADFHQIDRHAIFIDLTAPTALAAGAVLALEDRGEEVTFLLTRCGGESQEWPAHMEVHNADIFGRSSFVRTFSNAAQWSELLPPGRYRVSFEGSAKVRRFYCLSGLRDRPVIGDVKDGYSAPRLVRSGDAMYAYTAAIGSDTRFIGRLEADGSERWRQVERGIRQQDINHAGGFVLEVGGGILVGSGGHNERGIRCDYFPNGDLEEEPATFIVGHSTSRWSYPNVALLPDGNVVMHVRGNSLDVRFGHHAIVVIFDPESGAVKRSDVFSAPDDDWRMYLSDLRVGTGSDGRTYIGFIWNPRSYTSDFPERICAATYAYDEDRWYAPDGSPIGTSTPGTDDAPRVSKELVMRPIAAGGCLIMKVSEPWNTLLLGDVQSAVSDVSQMPERMRCFVPYFLAAQEPSGGFDEATELRSLTVDGATIHQHGNLKLGIPGPITAFCSVAMRWRDDDPQSGALEMIVGVLSRREMIPGSREPVSPYYTGWGGGDAIEGFTIMDAFTSEPGIRSTWQHDAVDGTFANLRPVPGDPSVWAAVLKPDNQPHPVMARSEPVCIRLEDGAVVTPASALSDGYPKARTASQ